MPFAQKTNVFLHPNKLHCVIPNYINQFLIEYVGIYRLICCWKLMVDSLQTNFRIQGCETTSCFSEG